MVLFMASTDALKKWSKDGDDGNVEFYILNNDNLKWVVDYGLLFTSIVL